MWEAPDPAHGSLGPVQGGKTFNTGTRVLSHLYNKTNKH